MPLVSGQETLYLEPQKACEIPLCLKDNNWGSGAETFLNISLHLDETVLWADEGHELGWWQFPLASAPQ
ncbi:DUF4981 domain-containing protein [Veronia nyctiphanis]|uniref:DUF4981 domain-containing protein n=1 Tax=Veronia nyctiphanis TaxID=1278244 RepID=UPI001F2836A8|nr:DUF4981 domain-containing protein [Veronia nyctiphanis]